MSDVDEQLLAPAQRPLVIKQMVDLAQRLGERGAHDATPRMYVALTKVWRRIFLKQRQKISDRVEHLRGGLQKLAEAEQEVARLTQTANKQRSLLTAKQEEADRAMEQIQRSMEGTVEKRREVEHLQSKLAKEEGADPTIDGSAPSSLASLLCRCSTSRRFSTVPSIDRWICSIARSASSCLAV